MHSLTLPWLLVWFGTVPWSQWIDTSAFLAFDKIWSEGLLNKLKLTLLSLFVILKLFISTMEIFYAKVWTSNEWISSQYSRGFHRVVFLNYSYIFYLLLINLPTTIYIYIASYAHDLLFLQNKLTQIFQGYQKLCENRKYYIEPLTILYRKLIKSCDKYMFALNQLLLRFLHWSVRNSR